ncbi:MAG: DUF4011 domain-containing protein [Phycisphaera sp.]|nr:DUF4011 domain-containing protein [Phycisphaera sp.]
MRQIILAAHGCLTSRGVMGEPNSKILQTMLDRLFASIVNGPSLNCRPHNSRQRLDWTHLAHLGDQNPVETMQRLLGDDREVRLAARHASPGKPPEAPAESKDKAHTPAPTADAAPAPPEPTAESSDADTGETSETSETGGAVDADIVDAAPAEPPAPPVNNEIKHTDAMEVYRRAVRDHGEQKKVLSKLRVIAEEAKTYEDDTGVYVLNVGFPLLSLNASSLSGGGFGGSRRILAPLAFVPVNVKVKAGAQPGVELACREDEVDRVVPNTALLAWLEQQTGKPQRELFEDEEGTHTWQEICDIVKHVCASLEMPVPSHYTAEAWPDDLTLRAAPRADDTTGEPEIFDAAVLGLFPMSNQGLLRDTQAMLGGESLEGPVESFIRVDVSLDQQPDESYEHETSTGAKNPRNFTAERLVANADPCQARAVSLARTCKGLVVHGPPGTGKSQTITNIIGDHLARGERVLFVCDKRTALDVVSNRLDYLGIGGLCAVVHDPQRDQKDLYMSIRNELEQLAEAKIDEKAAGKLEKVDVELQKLHDELTDHWRDLMEADAATGMSFHQLMGDWLAIDVRPELTVDERTLADVTLAAFQQGAVEIDYVFQRGEAVGYSSHPWVAAAGVTIGEFLSRSVDAIRKSMRATGPAAANADATRHESIPAFGVTVDLLEQGAARTKLAEQLDAVLNDADAELAARWANQRADDIRRDAQRLADVQPAVDRFRGGPLDAELSMLVRTQPPNLATIARQIATLEAYIDKASRWYGFACLGDKSRAKKELLAYGQQLTPDAAQRVLTFLQGLRDRLMLAALCDEFAGVSPTGRLPDDASLGRELAGHARMLGMLASLHAGATLEGLAKPICEALIQRGRAADEHAGDHAAQLLDGLRRSEDRAKAVHALEQAMVDTKLIGDDWLGDASTRWRGGAAAGDDIEALNDRLDTLEDVLRIADTLGKLPAPIAAAARQLLARPIAASEGIAALRKAVYTAEIRRRLADNARLQQIDAHRLTTVFDRYRKLDQDKLALVRATILHRWVGKQQERLLVGTGSRLNGAGADLRRRLTTRGRHAMRLRQVLANGRKIEGGDPLMDMCPVWMASPETVAQVFPREPFFDAIIFDEASQCRLEEALPVLTRAKRVVIAGDPKQLPPTRFFESAVTVTDTDEIETDQDLFEAHQGEIEDLLGAALSLDIQQCYLDVHYRSQNADLIAFSNEQFYSKRLQAIPGHPSHVAMHPPLTLYRADGTYRNRTNAAEAEQVVRIVADLLRRAGPPSIGIACFNITQRDLISEKLDEAANNDSDFARRLDKARARRGSGSFEGLFVKNLENVQGDERDHIIISTTYGPDEKGRFYRRFGPLGRAGGGRRLNVLVTRARQEVHLVTSIPAEIYRALPPVPQGQSPNGGYLLFAYLHFAERLADTYEQLKQSDATPGERGGAGVGGASDDVTPATLAKRGRVMVRPSEYPSRFAEALAHTLDAQYECGSVVHWGNDGFCVDVALRHPDRPDDVTIGVLCDGCRFAQAEDMVEWDVFRAAVLESQGWTLHRVWTPQFFRDPKGLTQSVLQHVDDMLIEEAGRSTTPAADPEDAEER